MLEQRMELDVRLAKSTVGIYILQVKLFSQVLVYIYIVLSVFECKIYVTRYHILHVIRDFKN